MELNEIDASSIKNICGNIMAESDFWYQRPLRHGRNGKICL